MKKNILIICATHSETKIIKTIFGKKNGDLLFHYLTTRIGNYKAILETSLYLQKNQNIDFVLNIGVCGYFEKYKEIIQIFRIKNLHTNDELLPPISINFFEKGSIFCSETPLYKNIFDENIKFVDMESYGIELTLEKFHLPRAYIKIPVDKVGEESKNFDINKAIENINNFLNKEFICGKLEKFLKNKKNNNIKNIENISDILKCTFTEKELLKKYSGALKTLGNIDIEVFFQENNFKNKKDFFEKIQEKIQDLKNKIC